ncbi:MAG: hypothetical protein A2898_00375 [Candidatus Kerfeldbacteria bacterium RIFCSPLOWO2_01_FULL_48_11]|uniref:Segregation and condensation protein A n=1 Tax=Candidatus Kerfeldbacteria bacterium RIFCSPLOWO2_01_FULL_48_11 TaxID=1798543 RepID=A0A1G2B6T8_9BACT|nr:MAG: Segregation and condensation protein A [Parcubacteria group bacterium GW2011_GWA2_48_9]KKW15783.1 MAG: Segregation and condensation protein A [Parcubacteria group bacterium GW2011_GWC2_49_9]OGY84406.1 MAG: hypothetical protein A2898_00375 [Candidatus Kerfeldbacteria bacterium RIFCSPLOWO2_01_FULL_48_11]HCJ52228.1 hypothetical protein [Candidatus Kerfeldbacteria bacterium]HCM68098.1 hypothetical protein [Candidatus Kerfeldbacteria bacterium]
MHKVKLQQFEGPLDLLLQLIEQKELDISQVALADVTEQYIKYLQQVEQALPEELADFLVVAAKLLLIKSRILLPSLEVEEEGSDLEQQLRMYREYYEASKGLHAMILKRRFLFARDKPAIVIEPVFNPPKGMTSMRLKELFLNVLAEIEPIISMPRQVYHRTISIEEKINSLREKIQQQATMNFQKLFTNSKDKTEIIVTFLALLELVKQRIVVVVQKDIFSDIEIKQFPEQTT